MNSSFNSQNLQKYSKHNKKRLNQEQVKLLEASFDSTKKLDLEKKLQLSRELGVPPRQISIWYQNRRARWKNQSMENDYNALQLKLENALSEKMLLEKETKILQGELEKGPGLWLLGVLDCLAALPRHFDGQRLPADRRHLHRHHRRPAVPAAE